MNFSKFFISRPIFAAVLSLLILIAGAISLFQLPISEYPEVVPPTVVVRANFPGANPKVIGETVAAPLEQAITGVENMLYMSSQSTADGKLTLTITFALGTDLDNAQVQVQNRVTRTQPKLPEEVTRIGITVDKASPDLTMVVHLTSPDQRYDMLYLSNYAILNIKDELARLGGVGDVQLFGMGDYSLRVWLDPNKTASRNLTATDVVNAIREQNRQVAAGALGAQPAPSDTSFQLSVNTQGRLVTEEEFENIVIRAGANGEITRLKDIARVELGSSQYALRSLIDNQPAVAIPIFQRPGSNAIDISNDVRAKMAELKKGFPAGMDYRIAYDPTIFVRGSIEAVVHTLFEALILVVLVVILFLQTWRASIIPLVAVPVSLIGTFAVMHLFGFSLNALSLFGLVLAIGIVVDDAIVVVENVERNIELGLEPFPATEKAMREVTGPIVATALVLCAVFIPAAFISGLTGQFYKQFALTIAISTVISAFNSLTLSPALAAVLLRAHDAPKDRFSRFLDKIFGGWLFRPFNRFFEKASHGYVGTVRRVIRGTGIALFVYAGLMVLTFFGFAHTPTGFVPAQDKQYLVAFAQLPDAASLDRTESVMKRMSDIALKQPGVESAIAFPGLSINGFTNSPNSGIVFVTLKPFDERKDASMSAGAIAGALNGQYASIEEAYMAIFPPPPVQGLGTIGGFRLQIEDRGNLGYDELYKEVQNVITKSHGVPELFGLFTSYTVNVPQVDAAIDREKAKTHGVAISDIFDTLQVYLGSLYANDFNRFGRTYQVNVQAEQQFRQDSDQIGQLKVRNNKGEMIPLATFIKVSDTSGPDRVMHYNGFITAEINGNAAPGYSSGQAQAAIEKLLKDELPNGMTYEWTDLTYQQILSGNTALFVFPLCVLLAFLVLAAQYESWSLPLAVILIVPMTLLSAITGVIISGGDNNIFTQIGLIVLVGLACKNAILIVEFAKDKQQEGLDPLAAVLEACRLRLRPILMTSFAFIMGVVPLVLSSGAGAEMRHAMGVAVFSGMIGVTFFGLLLTPVFYVLIRRYVERSEARKAAKALKLETQQ
ncbi:Multidrug efflux system, inner membrane proton/drug antiporter (RND type) MexF [Pseudomonas sp. R2-37-08W]|uniref:efflux RND transporter permease subunit n=1 Tax=unclassified Pseudomonas TaxID=196821 RepID=UPI000F55E6AF|nr:MULTISPECIES: efflux RND transporter permease subunit [unclassified Pseudomonas]AZF10825.1 Multidrug efflux system, inner membrane proton/drug antiporter (RND type) MexF [Pseudomonas sp. R2-37-08W]AZF21420.1 Multidrug efflux system, inner membrane proton/drug antiporter (RND type) MexF [Pseudomonas sp. R3-52-08]AZF26752.1 Multidrug efflux system, inner membrane proton/drug antiporter (RND type) MexF [Pseudomonas sp. R2-60-08W]AZF32103.1 Multidrug efflux system, inner membrane proton/drug ant